MILKAFKEKSNKKHLNKMLSKRNVYVGDSKIQSLGVILSADEYVDFESFAALANGLNIHQNQLKIIAYSAKNNAEFSAWKLYCEPKDFGWSGTIKNVELKTFLDTGFDALISYYTHEDLQLKLMTALSKAKFKIGIMQTDIRLNDLIIKTNVEAFEIFKDELLKYLMILNKIKNEQ
ncbi:DUF6913 domain-containing protein [Mariniflexile ostreae]|uniref:DUF6913 domain-containing protein n=1 Tax=Mariniflexile ostreae TaxID=1520892 RepID=A0ABV5FEN2_9FLAO